VITFRFDGRELTAPDGATVASALLGNGVVSWRETRRGGAPRGLFCGIGHCHDCLVTVNAGMPVRACQTQLRDADDIRSGAASRGSAPATPAPARVHADVAVVGAGPGGMAAALAAADVGCRVALIDSAPSPGGQIYRQPVTAPALPDRFRRLTTHPRITLLPDATVWQAGRDAGTFTLRCTGSRPQTVTARAVVLATGAAELVLPFDGWTLPGVITAGAAQALMKSTGTLPGSRILVAGTGPLLLRAAADLVRHGATVVAVCDTARPAAQPRHAIAALRHPAKLAEAARYATTLARANPRPRILQGWAVLGAYGDGRVRQARVTNGRHTRMLAVDTVAVSHGLVPALELSRALGCHDEQLDGFPAAVVSVDASQQTTTPGVFAAGELTGIGGAAKAEPEGTLAGLSAARHAGATVTTRTRDLTRKIAQARHFAALLARLYPLPEHWLDNLTPSTTICRCEETTLADLTTAIGTAQAHDLRTIKGLTRCGMGYCQGRICGPVAQAITASLTGGNLATTGDLHTRHIATPVPLSELRAAT